MEGFSRVSFPGCDCLRMGEMRAGIVSGRIFRNKLILYFAAEGGVSDVVKDTADLDARFLPGDGNGAERNVAGKDIDRFALHKADLPDDAGSGEPAAVRAVGVVHLYGDDVVLAGADFFRDIKGKRGEAIGVKSFVYTVDIDIGVLVDAVKGKEESAALFFLLRQGKVSAVPADSALHITGAARTIL